MRKNRPHPQERGELTQQLEIDFAASNSAISQCANPNLEKTMLVGAAAIAKEIASNKKEARLALAILNHKRR